VTRIARVPGHCTDSGGGHGCATSSILCLAIVLVGGGIERVCLCMHPVAGISSSGELDVQVESAKEGGRFAIRVEMEEHIGSS
jgi:hypothetical protein